MGPALFLLVFWCALAGAEDVIQCKNRTYELKEGSPVRATSWSYPNVANLTNLPCQMIFWNRQNRTQQITFVNGFLDEGQELMLFGLLNQENGKSITLNTALSYGTEFKNFTYFAGPSLRIVHRFFNFHYWFGFEAIVSIIDESPKCGTDLKIALEDAHGPLEFGTDWNSHASNASVCSWSVTANEGQAIKVVVKYASLLKGETLEITGPDGKPIPAGNTLTSVHRFPQGGPVNVIYNRVAPSSSPGTVYLQASSYDNVEKSQCDIDVGQVRTLGSEHDLVTLENSVIITNGTGYYRAPYLSNQNCLWSFTAELGYEMHFVVEKAYTETCCDVLALTAPTLNETTIDSFSDQHFVFPRNSSEPVNISWVSDGNIALQEYSVYLEARECACLNSEVTLTIDDPVEDIYSFADKEYCNNVHCQHKVFAPAGFSIALALDVTLRSGTEDELIITDGQHRCFYKNSSTAPLTYSGEVISFTGYMEINLTAGAVWRYKSNEMAGTWSGTLRLFGNETETTLSLESPAVYRSSKFVGTWTIHATKNVELLALSGPMDGINWFSITDGNGTYLGDFSDCENPTEPIVSYTDSLSIVRTAFDGETDFAIYARDTGETRQCEEEIVQLLEGTENIFAKASGADFCYVTLDDAWGTVDGDHYIRLTDVSYTNAFATDPILILAGVITNKKNIDDVLIVQLDNTTSDIRWNFIEIHDRLATIRLPKGASLNATAYRHANDDNKPRMVWCGESGTLASREYGHENRQFTTEIHDQVSILDLGRSLITLQVTAFLGVGDKLVLSSSSLDFRKEYTDMTVIRENVTFAASGFKVDYTPSATGEKGFLVKYTFADCHIATTVAPPEPYDYEDLVRCTDMGNDTVYTFDTEYVTELTPIRVETRDYPFATLGTHAPCRVEFSAPGLELKVQFVNAYLVEGQEVTVTGLDTGNITTVMNTGLRTHFQEYTYTAHDDLVIQLPEFNVSSWFGFEALVTVAQNHDRNCYNYYVVDLDHFEGPVEFGTNWIDNSGAIDQPPVCSWHLKKHSGFGYVIKLRVLKASFRSGESLYFFDDFGWNISYVEGNNTYVFENQDNVYVNYIRTGKDSSSYGVYFQASNAWTKYPPSSDYCQQLPSEPWTMGSNLTTYTLSNLVNYRNGTLRQYFDNQNCEWPLHMEPEYELRVYIRELVTEECCDSLTMDWTSNNTVDTMTFASGSSQLFIVDRSADTVVNFTWLSDPSVSLTGFTLDLDAANCTCAYATVDLTRRRPRQVLSSYDSGYAYCNDIHCVNEIFAPSGFTIVLNVAGKLRIVPDYILVETTDESDPSVDTLFFWNGTMPFDKTVYSDLTSMMKITLDSGHMESISDRSEMGHWNGVAVLISEYSPTTTLSRTDPGAYKSSAEFGVWTIDSFDKVQLVAFSEDRDALKAFQLHDGDDTTTGVPFDTLFYNNTKPFTSTGRLLTVTREDWRVEADFSIVVRDSASSIGECRQPFLFETDAFSVNTTSGVACSFTMVNTAEHFAEDHFISLRDITIQLAKKNDDVVVIAGAYSTPDDSNILLKLNSAVLSAKWMANTLVFHERIITLVFPPNAELSAYAYVSNETAANLSLPLGERSSFSSRDFGRPNYRFESIERYIATCDGGNSQIFFDLNFDFQMGGGLVIFSIPAGIRISYPGEDSSNGHVSFNFTAVGFVAEYLPQGTGELGFFLTFTFGNAIFPTETSTAPTVLTTTTTTTTTTTSIVSSPVTMARTSTTTSATSPTSSISSTSVVPSKASASTGSSVSSASLSSSRSATISSRSSPAASTSRSEPTTAATAHPPTVRTETTQSLTMPTTSKSNNGKSAASRNSFSIDNCLVRLWVVAFAFALLH